MTVVAAAGPLGVMVGRANLNSTNLNHWNLKAGNWKAGNLNRWNLNHWNLNSCDCELLALLEGPDGTGYGGPLVEKRAPT